jgi:hypothetical protein
MRERERREGGARMGEGQGRQVRAGQAGSGRAGLRRGSKSHNTHNH